MQDSFGVFDVLMLIGSLGLFIYGMKMMSEGIQKVAGNKMREILAAMTSNRFTGLITGFFTTALIQSSSATTVMIVSFVNAGLLTLRQAIGVIMGANIGTTITAILILVFGFSKFSISDYSLPLIAIGFPLMFFKNQRLRSIGETLIGFSILFMGLDFLKDSVPQPGEAQLQYLIDLTQYGIFSTLLFVAIGTVITIVVQSSSAAMALTLIMCGLGLPLEIAAAIVLGENIGTTITANIAALIGNAHAKRAARAHLIFNVIGVIWMLFAFNIFLNVIRDTMAENSLAVPESEEMVQARTSALNEANALLSDTKVLESYELVPVTKLSPSDLIKVSAGMGSDDVPGSPGEKSRQYLEKVKNVQWSLAFFHMSFNIINTFLLIWFVGRISKIVVRMVPAKNDEDEQFSLEYIGAGIMNTPELSLIEAQKELVKYGGITHRMMSFLKELLVEKDKKAFQNLLDRIQKYEEITDRIEVEVADYLLTVSQGEISDDASRKVRSMLSIVSEMEQIGDVFYQMSRTYDRKRKTKSWFTPEQRASLAKMFELVDKSFENMVFNLEKKYEDIDLDEAEDMEKQLNEERNKIRKEHLDHMGKGDYNINSGMIYSDLYSSLQKVGNHIMQINESIAGKV